MRKVTMRSRLAQFAAVLLAVSMTASACPGDSETTGEPGRRRRIPAKRDALHQRHPMGPAQQLEPDRALATPWAPSASPTKRCSCSTPEKLELTPVAGREGRVDRQQDLHAHPARGHQVGRRQAARPPTTSSTPSSSARSRRCPTATCGTGWARVEVVDPRTVKFTFTDPRYQEWDNWLYENAIVPKHIWSTRSEADITTTANEKPVGTGPYEYLTHDQDRMVWKKKADWWATKALKLEVKPKLHRGHRELQQRGRARPAAAGQDGPEQQLPARHRQPRSGQVQHQDLLSRSAVHALGEHGDADPQHHQGADERRGVPPGARLLHRHQEDRRGRLRQDRQGSQPDRSAAHLGQLRRPGGRRRSSASSSTPRRRKKILADAGYTRPQRRRLRRDAQRRADQAVAHRPVRLDRLDGGHPRDQRRRAGGRHQRGARVPRRRRARRRPHGRASSTCSSTTGPS